MELDRPKAADLGVQVADAAEAIRLLVAGDQVTTYNDGGEQYEVHLRAQEQNRGTLAGLAGLPVPSSRLGVVSLDNLARFTRGDAPATINRMARQRQVTLTANLLPGTSQGNAQQQIMAAARTPEHGAGVPRRLHRPVARAEPHRHRVPDRDRAVVRVHVPDPGGAVRVVAPPGDDPAVAAADAAVRAHLAHRLPAVAEHLLGAGAAGAVRRGEEELDSADRPRQPAPRRRDAGPRGGRPGQPRPAAADPDDDAGLRRRHGPAGGVAGRRRGHQPRHRLGGHRRADAGAAGHAGGHPGGLFAVRPGAEVRAQPASGSCCGAGSRPPTRSPRSDRAGRGRRRS